MTDRIRTGTARLTTSGARRYTTATTSERDDRTRVRGSMHRWRQIMFSMPLAYPSTLDRRPPGVHVRADVVLRGGALEPEPRTCLRNRRLKHTLNYRNDFTATPRVFLSQAGPRFELDFFKLGITPCVPTSLSPPKRRRRPDWVALTWSCYAARYLAHPPLREGPRVTGPALVLDGLVPRRGGRSRVGRKCT